MIDTDLIKYEKQLKEIIAMFDGGDELKIRHRFVDKEDRFSNTVTINGKTFAFCNLVSKNMTVLEKNRKVKMTALLSLYRAISTYLGVTLPWGSLTGIRPTKLAYMMLEKGENFSEEFIDTYKVSENKTKLVEEVIESQKDIYVKSNDNVDFFVFIPFCPSRCKYCSFICQDVKSAEKYIDLYVDTLCRDIIESGKLVNKIRSIYVGGGTPVSLSDDNLEKVLSAIDTVNTGVEFTFEAGRPDRITKENLEILKKHKVTRICINPQTFNDKTLESISRKHTSKDVIDSFNLAKGQFSINMDLIAGFDGEDIEDFKYSLSKCIELDPDNITVHTLCLKKGAFLKEEENRIKNSSVKDMVDYAYDELKKNGYYPYYLYRQKYMAENLENVGYSKKGKECIYNVDTMEEISSIVACGANAISKKVDFTSEKIVRYATPRDVKTYIDKIDEILEQKKSLFNKK